MSAMRPVLSNFHGKLPVTITNKITPKLHMSTAGPEYCFSNIISGGA